jgi:hypothetical protein
MEPDRLAAMEARLQELEKRVSALDGVSRVTEYVAPPQPPPPPPPRIQPPPVQQYQGWQTAENAPPPRPVWERMEHLRGQHQDAPQQPRAQSQDTEYFIGAKILPWVGALVVLSAVLYFVQWGFKAGWITPAMVFTGEIIFCLAFICLGQWKRNEREQYGQILTGVGSCGLYLSLAGGHLVQNLYSGETLVGSFMVLSFANLFYGMWSNSRAFLAIGILGGFSAALLPMKEHKTTLNAILHVAILLPAALIAARRKWADMSGWLWLFSLLASIPVASSAVDWQLRVAIVYLSGLASVAAYVYSAKKNVFDPQSTLGPAMLFVSGLVGFAIEHHRVGSVHLLMLGAGVAALGVLSSELRLRMFVAGIAIPAILAPFCFTPVECVAIFIGLSLVAAALSAVMKNKIAAWFAATELVLGLVSYMWVQSEGHLAQTSEAWLVGGIIAAVIATAYAGSKGSKAVQAFTLGAMALILPLFARLGMVTIAGTDLSPSPNLAALEAVTVFALAAIGLASVTRWLSAVVAMWVAFGVALMSYASIAGTTSVPAMHEVFMVSLLVLIAAVGLPVATENSPEDFGKAITGVAGVVIGFLIMRLSFVVAMLPSVHANAQAAVIVTGSIYAICAAVVSFLRKSDPELVVSWIVFAASAVSYVITPTAGLGLSNEALAISGLLAAFVLAAIASVRSAGKQPEIWHIVSLLGWVVLTRWVDVVLTWGGVDLHGASTLTVAWIVYALVVISIGFLAKIRELRYWSLGVMFTTTTKIVAVDLAYTTIPFRVGVLLGLGLLMLGGGYWYIRGKQNLPTGT